MNKIYKGYRIEFCERGDKWEAYKEGSMAFSNSSRKALLEMLDTAEKKKFKRLPIYYRDYTGEGFTLWEMTSVTLREAFIVRVGGRDRKKIWDSSEVGLVNDHNAALVGDIKGYLNQIKDLEKNIETAIGKMQIKKVSDIINEHYGEKQGSEQ